MNTENSTDLQDYYLNGLNKLPNINRVEYG